MEKLGIPPYFLTIDWDSLMEVASEWLGLKYNSQGAWNCPEEGGFNALPSNNYLPYYCHGESKFCVIFDVDPPCETDILDPKEFIERENKGRYHPGMPKSDYRDKTDKQKEFDLYPLLRSLFRAGYLEQGQSYFIHNEW